LSRSYRLTREGEQVRDRAREIEERVADIARFASSTDQSSRIVRVSGPPTLAQFLAPHLLPLRGEQPGLRIELMGEARQVNLSKGEADLAIRAVRPAEKGLVARKLAVVAFGLYGSRDYLARRGTDPHDYVGYDESLDYLPQQRWLKMLAGDRGFAFRSNDLANLVTAARAGLGLAALPCIMAQRAPELVNVPTSLAPFTQELWLLFHRDIGRLPHVRTVIERITTIMKSAKAFRGESSSAVSE